VRCGQLRPRPHPGRFVESTRLLKKVSGLGLLLVGPGATCHREAGVVEKGVCGPRQRAGTAIHVRGVLEVTHRLVATAKDGREVPERAACGAQRDLEPSATSASAITLWSAYGVSRS
jgi:hypothetical protein